MNVICFRHPDYDGCSSPVLSCKTCCSIFLAELKRQAEARGNQKAEAANAQSGKYGFNPQTI